MDYEQKYKEALERARKIHHETEFDYEKGMMEEIFPEIKDSEDERIMKAIKGGIKHLETQLGYDAVDGVDILDIYSWLEKQGKNKNVSIWKHWKNGIAGNGEDRQIYLIKVGNTYDLSSCLSFECDYIELSELDNLMLEKRGEQNDSCWSKDDQKMLEHIISDLREFMSCETDKELISDYEKEIAWLEKQGHMLDPDKVIEWLHYHIQVDKPKTEYNEEGQPLAESFIAHAKARCMAADEVVKQFKKDFGLLYERDKNSKTT